MKKIFYCLMAALLLMACNNKSQDNGSQAGNQDNAAAQSEMPEASPDEEVQGEWIKQTTLQSSKPMVIDFYATWCGPCKQQAPILDEIELKHKGDVIFKRIDVDQEPELAQEFRIQAIPTLMFVTPKGDYQTLVGLQEAAAIEVKIAELLTRSAN